MEDLPYPGLALGKFLTHSLAGENRHFFKQPGKSVCVSDLCDFLTRTSFVQSKSLTTPPVRVLCNLRSTRGGQARALPKVEKFWTLSGKPPSAGAGKLEIDCIPGIHHNCQSPLLGSTILWEKVQNFSILGKGPPRAIYG